MTMAISDDRSIANFIDDVVTVLNASIHVHSKRSFLYKAVANYTDHIEAAGEGPNQFWSNEAHSQCESEATFTRRHYRREHPFPIRAC